MQTLDEKVLVQHIARHDHTYASTTTTVDKGVPTTNATPTVVIPATDPLKAGVINKTTHSGAVVAPPFVTQASTKGGAAATTVTAVAPAAAASVIAIGHTPAGVHAYPFNSVPTKMGPADDDANSAISTDSRRNQMDIDLGEETETAPEGEGDENAVTRCVCDLLHDDGYMIACDRCL